MTEIGTTCPQCGAVNAGTRFCPECGAALSAEGRPDARIAADGQPVTRNEPTEKFDQPPARAPSQPEDITREDARDIPAPLKRVAALKPAGPSVDQRVRRLIVWAGVACLLAIIGIAAGAAGIVEASNAKTSNSSLRQQVAALRQRLSSVQTRQAQIAAQMTTIPGRTTMAAVQSSVSSLQQQVSGQGKTLNGLRNHDATYSNCIPELQTELDSLTINWTIDTVNVNNSSFYINNSSQVSHDCTKLLYGG